MLNLSTNLSQNSISYNAFLQGANKKQWGVGEGEIISNFTNVETFLSYDNQVLLWVISQCLPLLAPSKKGLLLPFTLAKKRIYLDNQLKGEVIDLFWKLSHNFPQAE